MFYYGELFQLSKWGQRKMVEFRSKKNLSWRTYQLDILATKKK